jgi:hypothetical protein
MPRLGSWGLPEFGITEKISDLLGKSRSAQGGSNLIGPSTPAYNPPQTTTVNTSNTGAVYGPTLPSNKVLGAKTSSVTGGGNQQQAGMDTLTSAINNQVNTGNNAIDDDYNNYMNSLNSQQGYMQEQGNQAMIQMNLQANQARTQYGQEKTVAQQGLDTQTQTANTQATSAMQQARDLYRQVQQQNIAQLSGAGLSSSSVAEALAEKLGVETARRIAGVTGSRDEIIQNITKEKSNLDNYYQQKLTNLEDQLTLNTKQIQSQLMQSLDQINQARNVAASERANKRAQLMSEATTQIANLQANAQQFAQSLQMWKEQNSAKLTQTVSDVTAKMTNFTTGLNQLNSTMPGYDLNPSFSVSDQGYLVPSQLSAKKKTTDEDLTF